MNSKEQNPAFAYLEIVRAIGTAASKTQVFGQKGVVLGITETENGGWYYTAYVPSDNCCWCFEDHEIVSTGEFADPADFERSRSVRVRVDDSGRGSFVE